MNGTTASVRVGTRHAAANGTSAHARAGIAGIAGIAGMGTR